MKELFSLVLETVSIDETLTGYFSAFRVLLVELVLREDGDRTWAFNID